MNRVKKAALTEKDLQLGETAIETSEHLRVDGRHEVAATLRASNGQVFTSIHIESSSGNADVCGEVAAICVAVSRG